MRISLIAAVAANGVIGRDNGLPWNLPADLRLFQRLTLGHTLVMGRRTWESFATPLPGRRIVVITRRPDWRLEGLPEGAQGVEVAHTLDEALERARDAGDPEAFVAGGTEIFREALPRADRIYLTRVEAEVPGDTYFPAFDRTGWKIVEEEHHEADADHSFPFTFQILERV
ncbi:MAG TPA: dihydrofolate reductase [Thermoanaerobaculia bacterium]|nr:dihydrofolate reductase [Thermoanaerobaculia bacterium]